MFKRLLLGAFLLLPSLVGAGDLQSRRFFNNTGGLIDHISPLLIPDQNASAIENITMDDRGQLSKRNGYTVIISTFALDRDVAANSTWTVTGMAFHRSTIGSDFFAVVTGTNVWRTSTSYSAYTNVTGTVTINATATNLAQSTHLVDKAIFCNELDRPFYVGSSGNAQALDTNMTTFSSATTCATYGNYLVAAHTVEASVSFPNRVRWSDINNINSFPALNYVDVEPDDGDKIVGMVSFDESVYIFKQRSIYRMLITGQDGPSAFIIRPISRGIGAWSKMALKVIPNVGIAFLSDHTVYILGDNGLTPIGDSIQRTIDTIQHSQWATAVGEVYPEKYQYWLAVSTTGTTNAQVLIYDYIQKNWTVYDGMKVGMLGQAQNSSGKNILISGDYQATTYLQDSGSVDTPHGTQTAIVGSYTTANLTFDSPEITKAFKYLYIIINGDTSFTLTTQAAFDYSSNYEFVDTSVTNGSSVYGVDTYDSATYSSNNISVVRLELNRSSRAIRLKFTNSTSAQLFGLVGWVPVYSLEDYRQ